MFKDIRKLYGRSQSGMSNRRVLKITMTPETFGALESSVEFGKGKYGSAYIELATRLLYTLSGNGENIQMISEELQKAGINQNFADNLRTLAKYLEA
jgi:hypothetical protein